MLDPNWTPEAGYSHAMNLMHKRRLDISGDKKAKYGCIVQFTNGIQKHFVAYSVTDAIKDAADYADENHTKISVISTPETIYRDIKEDRVFPPEARMLARVNRKDLYDGPS